MIDLMPKLNFELCIDPNSAFNYYFIFIVFSILSILINFALNNF